MITHLKAVLMDRIVTYFLSHRAPTAVSTATPITNLGFWVFLHEGDFVFGVQERIGKLKYKCIKVDAPEAERGGTFDKEIHFEKSPTTRVRVRMFYGNHWTDYLSPFAAFSLAVSGAYVVSAWKADLEAKRAIRKNKTAYSLYQDRLKLLEALMNLRARQYENIKGDPEKVRRGELVNFISEARLVNMGAYYTYVDPILKCLVEEGAIAMDANNITIKPKAWTLISTYYTEERRHQENRRLLRWQQILTAALVFAAFSQIFGAELRAMLGRLIGNSSV